MTTEPDKLLVVGIDPSKDFHVVVAVKYPDRVVFQEKVPNTPPEIIKLDEKMSKLAEEEGLELLYAPEDATKYGGLLRTILQGKNRNIKQVNPAVVSSMRTFYGDDKNDFIDARCAAAAALRKGSQSENLIKKGKVAKKLRLTISQRKRMVKLKTEDINVMHQLLFETWSCGYKSFFSRLDGLTALSFWEKYPSARLAKGVSVEELAGFIYEESIHRISRDECFERAKAMCETARYFPEEDADIAAINEEFIRQTAKMIKSLKTSIEALNGKIDALLEESGQKINTIKGCSTVTAGAIIGIVGEVSRFSSKDKFAKYAGLAPREKSSGKKKKHHASKNYNRDLKNAIITVAHNMIRNYKVSQEYYERKLADNKTAKQAKRCMARRACDIIYAMLRDGTAYDAAKHECRKNENEVMPGKKFALMTKTPPVKAYINFQTADPKNSEKSAA